MARLPPEIAKLFWEVDPRTIDLAKHRDYVMTRVMTRGPWAAMLWLLRTYSRVELREFVERRGARALAPRELAYWALMSGAEVAIPPGGGRPTWAGD